MRNLYTKKGSYISICASERLCASVVCNEQLNVKNALVKYVLDVLLIFDLTT